MIEEKEEVQKAQTEEVDGLTYTIVKIPRTKKVYKVRTLTNNQLEDIARLLFRDGEQETTEETILKDTKISAKAAAIYLTPDYWKRKLTYWFRWRWFYYIRQYDNAQLQPIISAGFGSTPYIDFLKTMSLLANQKDTQMRMTVKEAEKILQELSSKANTKDGNDSKQNENSQ